MTKKKNPIDEHKEKDLNLGRDELLKIINGVADSATAVKNKIEAIKLLARMHKGLQVDKTVVSATAQAGAFSKQELSMPELKTEHKEKLANLLNAQSS